MIAKPEKFFGNYVVEYTFNYRLPQTSPNEMDFGESLHSPLKRGMSDDTLTGVEAPKAACCALKYINPNFLDRQRRHKLRTPDSLFTKKSCIKTI